MTVPVFRAGLLYCWVFCLSLLGGVGLLHAAPGLVEIPPLQSAVTDLTGSLSPPALDALNQKLTQFAQQSGSQIAILMLPTTQPEDIAQFGIRLAEAWKIGRDQQDDGVIIIVAKNDRKMRIEVGYGLEGAIPDVVAKRIIREVMAPAFKQGHFEVGLNLAIDRLITLIQGEHLPAPAKQSHSGDQHWTTWLPMLLFAVIIGGAVFKSLLGTVAGSLVTGGLMGLATGWLGATLLVMALVAVAGFVFALAMGSSGGGGYMPIGGYPGWGGGRSSRDVFSGGGGDFGGGGASGDW